MPTEIGKLWKAINAKQKLPFITMLHIYIQNLVLNLLATKQQFMRGILFHCQFAENVEFG